MRSARGGSRPRSADEAVARIAEKTGRSPRRSEEDARGHEPAASDDQARRSRVRGAMLCADGHTRHPRPNAGHRRRSDIEMTTELVLLEGPVRSGYADGRIGHGQTLHIAGQVGWKDGVLRGEGPRRPVRADARQPARGVEGGTRPRRRYRLDDDLRHRHGRVSGGAQELGGIWRERLARTFQRWR